MENNFVELDREGLKITIHLDVRDLVVGKDDVEISYFSAGPGGQNVNRNLNGVRLIYNIPEQYRSDAFRTQQIVTRVHGKRSLHHNLQTAFEQLAFKLKQYFYVPPVRKTTKTPKKAKEKRLHDKKMKSKKKELRGKVKKDI